MLALMLSILFQTAAVACGKQGALSLHQFTASAILHDRFYLLSLLFLGLQAISWQWCLKHLPLAYAYSAMSLVYVNVLLLSGLVFKEHVSIANVAGAALIIGGVVLMTTDRRGAVID